MAIPSDCVWEVNTTGSDTAAGGGFSTAQKGATGVDKTYPTPTVTTFTSNLSAVGTTALTCASALFTNTMLGNVIQISGQGFYCIQGFTSTTVVTVDRALGTFAATSGWVGGALASPGQAGAVITVGNSIYVKTGSYPITSASTNVTGGCISLAASGSSSSVLEGYGTSRGDLVSPPTFLASGISTASIVIAVNQANSRIRNIIVDGASLTSIRGFQIGSSVGYLLTAKNCTNTGFSPNVNFSYLIRCVATGCSVQAAFNGNFCILCESYSNTSPGFLSASTLQSWYDCISCNNTGATTDGFLGGNGFITFYNCTSYGNGRDGFRVVNGNCTVVNSISEGNTGIGLNFNTTISVLLNCAAYNNSGGNTSLSASILNLGFVTGTASFFSNAASANFALNNNAGGGSVARGAGPGTFPRGLTTGYPDIGAAQSQATGGISRGRQVMG